jgi:hypothetical protein
MVRRSVRVLLVLVVAAVGVVAATVPAAAKLPPFTVTASPTTVDIGRPVTVEIALRDPSVVVPENADYLGPELRHILSVHAVLPSGIPDGTHEGEALVPTRVSSSVWQATYIPKRAGKFAVVSFDNLTPDPVNDYVPAPVPITVRGSNAVAAVEASGARGAPAADVASRSTPAASAKSSSRSTMWFATGAGAALVAGAGWALWSRRRTRTRVA